MGKLKGNERNWSSLLVAEITKYVSKHNNLKFTRAESENSLNIYGKTLFPDIILFNNSSILMGWELKLPDTNIDDRDFIDNAYIKAKALGVNSFLLWNFSKAVLYEIKDDKPIILKYWDNLKNITTREEALQNLHTSFNMLHGILNDINLFAQGKKVIGKPIVDLLSESELVDHIINLCKTLIYDSIHIEQMKNQQFRNAVINWWRVEKENYKEAKPYDILSLHIILSVMNKILFAHILKYSFKGIDNELKKLRNSKQGVFDTISSTYNFVTVFVTHLGEEFLNDETWNILDQFNQFLFSCELSEYTSKNGEEFLTSIIMRHKRKLHGQFSTPKWLAQLLVLLTVDDYTQNFLDPCCGTGTISKASIDMKKEMTQDISLAFDTVWSADKFSYPLQITSLTLTDPSQIQSSYFITQKDVFEWETNQKLVFKDPRTGKEIDKELPLFGSICSNLPFVRQEDKQNVRRINDWINKKVQEVTLNDRSDLYVYIPFACWRLLQENGRLGIIISNSWLGTEFGKDFYNLLVRFYQIEKIVTSSGKKWFNNANVITNILIMKKREEVIANIPTINHEKIQFITVKNIEQKTLQEIQEITASLDTETPNIIFTKQSYTIEEIEKYRDIVYLNTLFTNISWLSDVLPKTISLNNKFEIGRGERRGLNDLFYPISDSGIEDEYLIPLVKNITDSEYIATTNKKAFVTTEEYTNLKSGAKAWVDRFIHIKDKHGNLYKDKLKRGNLDWFQMENKTTADIITSINFDKRLFFSRCLERLFVDQRLAWFRKRNNTCDLLLESALLNSSLGLFFIEALGFPRGLKALDLNANKFQNFPILDSSLFTANQKSRIKELYAIIENRKVFTIPEELRSQDRIELDNYILESLGLAKFSDQIRNSLLFLYNMRQQLE